MITSNPKHIRKELARALVPVCNHLKLHGTDKFTPELKYTLAPKYDTEETHYTATFEPHGDRAIVVTIAFFYTLTLKFIVPIDQIQYMVPEFQAQRFAKENEHIVRGVTKFVKDIH